MSDSLMLKRKPATSDAVVDKERSEVLTKAHKLCREYLHGGWADVSVDEIEVTPLGGGLTNKLYICKLPEKYFQKEDKELRDCPQTVLLRMYGLILQDFKAQIQESVVFSILAERKVGPRLYAVFPGGRLEEYVPCRTLQTRDIHDRATSQYIAKRVAEYHQLNMPVKKEPTYITTKMMKYLSQAKQMKFSDSKSQQLYEEILNFDLDSLAEFVTKMISAKEGVVVFCHNDVQEGNILYSNRTTTTAAVAAAASKEGGDVEQEHEEACGGGGNGSNPVQMIDFEYSSYNYRGFEFGNHFCEWMYDYSYSSWPFYKHDFDNFATEEQQRNFVDSYLRVIHESDPKKADDPKWSAECILDEIKRYAMVSHLFWALWSVVQAQMSDIGFGYLEYAVTRLKDLEKQRDQWKL